MDFPASALKTSMIASQLLNNIENLPSCTNVELSPVKAKEKVIVTKPCNKCDCFTSKEHMKILMNIKDQNDTIIHILSRTEQASISSAVSRTQLPFESVVDWRNFECSIDEVEMNSLVGYL